MKFEYILSTLLATASITEASPIDLFKTHHTTSTVSEQSVVTNSVHHLNETYYNRTNTSSQPETLQFIVAGGKLTKTNHTLYNNFTELSNSTRGLNFTQLYDVAQSINATLGYSQSKAGVVITNENTIESLGFLSSLLFESKKPIVIGEDASLAAVVANDTNAASRGPLVVSNNGLIYAGALAPSSDGAGVPMGVVSGGNVTFFYEPSLPSLVAENSTIRTNYTNFTSLNVIKDHAAPVVPIIYDADYSSLLIEGLATEVQGLVVVSANATASTITSKTLPIVYTSPDAPFALVTENDVPEGAIAGGYLTPTKAQVLLSVAYANGVTDIESLKKIFA